MRKASRLFELIQILRAAKGPVTAARLAETLEVVPRSIYRDIAALQGMRVPIEGGRGVGYLLRPGFTMPPLMFTIEESEAIVLALALLERTGDNELKAAAKRVSGKIAAVVPAALLQTFRSSALQAWGTAAVAPAGIDLAALRRAVRDEQKVELDYGDEKGQRTRRVVWPLALIYYSETVNIVAWCELRQAIRNFRADRVRESRALDAFFRGHGERLRREWVAGWTTAAESAPRRADRGAGQPS
jgi:predicted DNA-binding transcriptional regulator YafY